MNQVPYADEYSPERLFWGTEPGSLVARHIALLQEGFVLDIGCGEGKNAVYLARHGARVIAVDRSAVALRNFEGQPEFRESRKRISRIHADVRQLWFTPGCFDAIVAYGLLHCFPDWRQAEAMIQAMKAWTRTGGVHIIAALTSNIPLDRSVHPYLSEDGLLPVGVIQALYSDSNIIHLQQAALTETHPTSAKAHTHGIVRAAILVND